MKFSRMASALVAGSLLLAALPAEAQSRGISRNNWRKKDRGSGIYQGTPQRFAFELRFGPYYPQIDQEAGLSSPVFKNTFGDTWFLNIGGEFDWQALRIPWVGTLGPGIGFSYVAPSAAAFGVGTYGTETPVRKNETSLTILPMHVSAVLRVDELFRRTHFPVVPYGKIGFGYGLWWCTVAGKDCSSTDGKEALGASYGLHWALGLSVPLDFLGRREMSALDQETGVNHIHIFGEWFNQNLGLGTNQMLIGTSTWVTGLTMEL